MSASALLLHRMLIKTGVRGWRVPTTSHGDPEAELTQTHPLQIVSENQNLKQSQKINSDPDANPDDPESPHYLRTEQRIPSHA